MNFRKILPEDQLSLNQYIKDLKNFQTDFSVVTILLFEDLKNPEISLQEKCIFIKGYMAGDEVFFAPLCKLEDFNDSIEKIISYYKQKDKPYKILYIQEDYIKEFLKCKNIIPDNGFFEKYECLKEKEFILFNDRNDAEYIYLPKNLIELNGNKYRKIREKIRTFNHTYNGQYEINEYTDSDYEQLMDSVNIWNNEKDYNSINESLKLKTIFENKEILNIKIYLLKINDIIAGMSILQILPNNVGVVVYEKSLSKYKNANCILNIFGVNQLKNCRGISRQEDMGIEGIRQAKLSFRPFYMEKKYNLYQFNENEFFLLYKSIFGDSDKLIHLVKNSQNFNIKHSSFILKNQKIISIGSTREKRLRIFNQIEEVPFIFGIATKKEERRKGYAGEILKNILNKINFDKYNIAMIAPKEEYLVKYYERYGFIKFNFIKPTPIQSLFKKNFDIKIGNINDSLEIHKLFNNYTNKYKIAQYRDLQFTIERLKEVFVDDGKLLILSINNINYGYIIYEQGIITENINLLQNEENENDEIIKSILINKNLSYILNCKTIDMNINVDEKNSENATTYSLIRMINPKNFVRKYIDFIFPKKIEDFNKNIIIKDSLIEDSKFNIKKTNNKNYFSLILDTNAENIDIYTSDLMKNIIGNLKKNIDTYEIEDKFYFTEKW